LAYIPLLGADPAHHGKGVGKALLLEMIRRVTALGFRELTLETWAGNLKAVPLYKRTGFNWEPETNPSYAESEVLNPHLSLFRRKNA
jgi:ribosomal protein S18 acetylase RimI-like enzyme